MLPLSLAIELCVPTHLGEFCANRVIPSTILPSVGWKLDLCGIKVRIEEIILIMEEDNEYAVGTVVCQCVDDLYETYGEEMLVEMSTHFAGSDWHYSEATSDNVQQFLQENKLIGADKREDHIWYDFIK